MDNTPIDQKHDGAERLALAKQLASLLLANTPSYEKRTPALTALQANDLEQNLVSTLYNTHTAQALKTFIEIAQTETGKHYLATQKRVYGRRFSTIDTLYNKDRINTGDKIITLITENLKTASDEQNCRNPSKQKPNNDVKSVP